MKKTLQTWNLAFMAICGIFGTLIGIAIIYFTTGKFDISILLGALTAATIFIVINIVKEFKKKDNLPETDERIRKNIMKYFIIYFHRGTICSIGSHYILRGRKCITCLFMDYNHCLFVG